MAVSQFENSPIIFAFAFIDNNTSKDYEELS